MEIQLDILMTKTSRPEQRFYLRAYTSRNQELLLL